MNPVEQFIKLLIRPSLSAIWRLLVLVSLVGIGSVAVADLPARLDSSAMLELSKSNYQFVRISVAQGLSQPTINDITQDRRGFLWIATQEGLNRYDGYEFKTYFNDVQDSGSLNSDYVWSLFVDRSGVLWVGTDGGGLSRYREETDSFVSYGNNPADPESLSSDRVRVIFEDRQGALWVGTDRGGLNRFDKSTGKFRRFIDESADGHRSTVLSIVEANGGFLWFGTDGSGLGKLEVSTGNIEWFRHDPARPGSLSNDHVRALLYDRSGRLWIGTDEGGLNLWRPDAADFKVYAADSEGTGSLSDNRVRALFEDRQGTIWVGTDSGLNEWRPRIDGFVPYTHSDVDFSSLSDNRITAVFQDRGNVFWVGTYNGLNKRKFVSEAFVFYNDKPDAELRIEGKVVTAFAKGPEGRIWVATYDGGLNLVDRFRGTVKTYFDGVQSSGGPPGVRIMALLNDQRGSLWVGSRKRGLYKLNMADGHVDGYEHDPQDPGSLSGNSVTSLHSDPDGTLWVGTYGQGLNRLRPESERFDVFRHDPEDASSLSSNRVLDIYRDSLGELWIGTEDGGLNRFMPDSQAFEAYRYDSTNASGLSSDGAWKVFEDSRGALWVATLGGGVSQWSRDDRLAGRQRFTWFGKAQGLVSNTIFGILEGNDGLLWLSSNRGISAVSPTDGWVRHFDQADGLPSADFNFGALLRDDRDGRMYFGGPEGVVAFFPGDVHVNTHAPEVAAYATTQGGRIARFFSGKESLPSVELAYPDRSISFDFAALDYASPEKNHYRYQLEGFDSDWIESEDHRRATYTNLPAGEYLFKVRGANNDGIWSMGAARVQLLVVPPPWMSNWAFAFYGLALMASLGLFLRSQYRKLEGEKAHARELETQVDLRTQELADRNRDLQGLNKQLKESSMSDSLTGLRNRRYLYEFLETEAALLDRSYADSQRKTDQPTAVDLQPELFFMMIDLDGFKVVNDDYGHHAGDKALLQVCDILRKCARKSDTVIRWGGDEFLLVGQCGGSLGSEKLAERVRFEIQHHQYQLGNGHLGRLSASIGMSLYPFVSAEPNLISWEQAIDIADQASYLAKQSKNAWVAIYSTDKTTSPDQLRALKVNINDLLQKGVVEARTSVDGGFVAAGDEVTKQAG